MQIKVEKLPKSTVKITVEVSAEKMKTFKDKACEQLSKEVKVKGFRSGHVPENVLEQHVGKDVIKAQTLDVAIPMTYAEAVTKEKLQVVSRPKINILSEDPFKYEAEVAVLPEVKVKDYDKIKIKKVDDKADKKEIEEAVEYMKKSLAEHKDLDRPLKKGDRAEIDFEGQDEGGAVLENTKSKNHPVVLGEKSLIKEFEENLEGMKKGDKKEFTVTFPKPYHAPSLEGKKVKFNVEIKKAQEIIIPKVDEAFVEKVTGRKISVKEFEADVAKNIQARKAEESKMKEENAFLEEVLKRTKVEVPDAMIEEEVGYMLEDMKGDMAKKGVKFEDYLTQMKLTEEKVKENYAKEAEKRIKLRLALSHIFREGNFEITDKEVEAEVEQSLQFYPEKEKEKIREMYKADRNMKVQIKNKLLLKKLFDKFLKVS
jgi:trigger factor